MQDYRTLQAWQRAQEACVRLYRLTGRYPAEETYGLTTQWRRAEGARPGAARDPRGGERLSAVDIVAAIPDDHTAVLEYVVGALDAPTTLFVLTRAGVRARRLPPIDSLADAIDRFVSLTRGGAGAWAGPAPPAPTTMVRSRFVWRGCSSRG